MRLLNFIKDKEIRLGVQLGEWVLDLKSTQNSLPRLSLSENRFQGADLELPANVDTLLTAGEQSYSYITSLIKPNQNLYSPEVAGNINSSTILPIDKISFLPPILRPGKLICVGLNYPNPDEVQSLNTPEYPVLFHKVHTSLVGDNQDVRMPSFIDTVSYEGELAVVIGDECKHIEPEEAHKYIAGYTIANDIGSPELESRTSQWTTGKMLDTFCPIGPVFVTADEITNPNSLEIKTTLNGVVVQDGNTTEMIFDIPFLVSYLSKLVPLQPADIILTGSPKRRGKDPDPRVMMRAGDHVSVEINKIGILTNRITSEV